MTNFKKLDENSIEITNKQTVFKKDLLSEKETIETRLVVLNEMLNSLK